MPGLSVESPERAAPGHVTDLLVAAGYVLLVAGLSVLFGALFRDAPALVIGLAAGLIALLILPARERIFEFAGRPLRAIRGQREIESFSVAIASAARAEDVAAALQSAITRAIRPAALHIFLYDPLGGQYQAAPGSDGKPSSDLRFGPTSPLVAALKEQTGVVRVDALFPNESNPPGELVRLRLLGAQWYVPLQGGKGFAGWLAVGKETLLPAEQESLLALANQSAHAIERCTLVTLMEMRIREMDSLGRVAQGVNVTVALDDIFELIYAQTTQVIPADDFQLVLLNDSGEMVRVFCVSGEERVHERENVVVPSQQCLEEEVIHRQKPLLSDDYQRECRQRNLLLAAAEPDFAWMSVPLNAGAETIGALSLGRRDPSCVYTGEQMHLLQAIADQVAGAIVKTRLLEETERRARQLATLNAVTSRLTSTLELEPLLDNILQSAVEILHCEAGSLWLLDEASKELVCRSAAGPVSHLIGRSAPTKDGSFGQALRERRPIIVPESMIDLGEEFTVREALVIPLVQQEQLIGAIEAYNRTDRSPFTQDDENLLAAFASQATVAIENARLYMLTDRALAARVEELSVMQRVDRELNTSLDTNRAMRITLEWAMRQSGADAGVIGLIQTDALQVVESQGLPEESPDLLEKPVPLAEFGLERLVQEGVPESGVLREGNRRLLANGQTRIAVPIQREQSTVGLIYLESVSPEPCSPEVLAFLTRLSDHASIAIANAQLYSAVESANVAKSEFVSFVAHELKNPMTSIKGYTELLAAGAVGPVNDAQANFLATIKSNIDRMNTLVSDLNDLSKIEAGRLRLEFKALNLPDVIEEVVRSLRRQIEDKEQELIIDLPVDLPQVWADRTRLAQVLVNLISNAHKYTEAGGRILVGVERASNRWDEAGCAEVLHIWVQDTGIGINAEDQKKIFQKFFRSEDPKTREVTGSGLGLNITRSLVEMQGGKIWFESEFRRGTTFHFTVPTAEQ